MHEPPRILVINGEPFNSVSATGITVSRLFANWPKDRIRQIYSMPISPDLRVCPANWRLYPVDCRPWWLPGGGSIPSTSERTSPAKSAGPSQAPRAKSGRGSLLKNRIRQELACFIDQLRYRVNPELEAWMDEFRPQIIYSIFSTIRVSRLVQAVADRYNLPVVPHMMDDWWEVPYYGASIGPAFGPLLRSNFKAIFPRVPLMLTISQSMSEAFEQRFGIPCKHYMNCLEDRWIDQWGRQRPEPRELSVAIMGSLKRSRLPLIQDMAAAVDLAGRKLGVPKAVVRVYASHGDGAALAASANWKSVSFLPAPSDEQMREVFDSNTIMAHVDDFADAGSRHYRYSMTAKLPIYLASGRPILAYGPAGNGSARFLEKHRCGLIAGDRNIERLADGIVTLARDEKARTESVNNAFRVLETEYRQSTVARSFHDAIAQITFSGVGLRMSNPPR